MSEKDENIVKVSRRIKKMTKHRLLKYGINPVFVGKDTTYSKLHNQEIYNGYDFLENFAYVRKYIQHKYDITLPNLEFLLKIAGMKVFTYQDLRMIPRPYGLYWLKQVLNTGLVDVLGKDENINRNVRDSSLFVISRHGMDIVRDFYKSLSGEEPTVNHNEIIPYSRYNWKVKSALDKLLKTPANEGFYNMYEKDM